MNITATALGRIGRMIGKPPGYERVVRALMPPGKVPATGEATLNLEGGLFVTRPAVPLDWNLFFFGTYEPEVRRVMRRVLRPESVAVDVGANIGWHTVLMAQLCGPTGRVLAFEPNASVMDRLRQTIRMNGLAQVALMPIALSDTSGRLLFRAPPAHVASSGDGHVLCPEDVRTEHAIIVEARALDSIVELSTLQRVDLIKMDVEGYEYPVLRGAEKMIELHRPHVLFEHNEEYVERGGGSAGDIHEYFTRYGYTLYALGRWGKRRIEPDQWPSSANVWAVPPRDRLTALC